MRQLLQFATYFDWLILPRTIAETFAHADWRAARKQGVSGIVAEVLRSLIGTNCVPYFVPANSAWGPGESDRLLRAKGVRMWGVGYYGGEMFFRVSRRQANWALYLMRRAGIPLLHER